MLPKLRLEVNDVALAKGRFLREAPNAVLGAGRVTYR